MPLLLYVQHKVLFAFFSLCWRLTSCMEDDIFNRETWSFWQQSSNTVVLSKFHNIRFCAFLRAFVCEWSHYPWPEKSITATTKSCIVSEKLLDVFITQIERCWQIFHEILFIEPYKQLKLQLKNRIKSNKYLEDCVVMKWRSFQGHAYANEQARISRTSGQCPLANGRPCE